MDTWEGFHNVGILKTALNKKLVNVILGFHVPRKDQNKNKCFLSKILSKKQKQFEVPLELYKMDVAECENDHSPPRVRFLNHI